MKISGIRDLHIKKLGSGRMSREFKVGDLVRIVDIREFCAIEDDLYNAIDNAIGIGYGMWDGDHAGTESTIRTIEKTDYRYPDGTPIYSIRIEGTELDTGASSWFWCDAFIEHVDSGFWKVNVFDEKERMYEDVAVSVDDAQTISENPTCGSDRIARYERATREVQDAISGSVVYDTLLDFDFGEII